MRILGYLIAVFAIAIIIPIERQKWLDQDRRRAARHRKMRERGTMPVPEPGPPPVRHRPRRAEGGRDVQVFRTRPTRLATDLTPWWTELLFWVLIVTTVLTAIGVAGGWSR